MDPIENVDTRSHLSETVPVSCVNPEYSVGALVYLSQGADWGPHPHWCSSSWSHHLQIPQTHPFGPLWSTSKKKHKRTNSKLVNTDQFPDKWWQILSQHWREHGPRLAPPHPSWSKMMWWCKWFNVGVPGMKQQPGAVIVVKLFLIQNVMMRDTARHFTQLALKHTHALKNQWACYKLLQTHSSQ